MRLVLILFFLLSPSLAFSTAKYISPTGNDANNGLSTGAPWKHWVYAFQHLVPGDVLNVMDGLYTVANNGPANAWCTETPGIVNGTSGAHITVKAINARQAHLHGVGQSVFWVSSCSYWDIEDLYISNIDVNPGSGFDGSVIYVAEVSDHINVRRNLIYGANAWFNSHCIQYNGSHDSIVEDNEIYYCHRHGIAFVEGANRNTARRNYIHSRDHADMAGGYPSSPPGQGRGDTGITCYPCNNLIAENNIVEDFDAGFDIQCKHNCADNKYYGNMVLSSRFGYLFSDRNDDSFGATIMPTNVVMRNNFAGSLDLNGECGYFRANKNLSINGMTCINGTSGGLAFDGGTGDGDGQNSFTMVNALVTGFNTTYALYVQAQVSWGIDYALLNGNAGGYTPVLSDPHYTHISTSAPALGNCKVFIPAGSAAKGTGLAGADMGANILYKYQDTVLSATPLWNTTTGAFTGCGAQVAGVNDIAGSSCFDVYKRLNVNFNGCILSYSVSTLPTPANFGITP